MHKWTVRELEILRQEYSTTTDLSRLADRLKKPQTLIGRKANQLGLVRALTKPKSRKPRKDRKPLPQASQKFTEDNPCKVIEQFRCDAVIKHLSPPSISAIEEEIESLLAKIFFSVLDLKEWTVTVRRYHSLVLKHCHMTGKDIITDNSNFRNYYGEKN